MGHDHAPHASHGHGHRHAHDHAHDVRVGDHNERKVFVALVVVFGFMLVEVAAGVWSGSLALLADAGHMLTDAVALGLAYAAFRYGRRAADRQRTFGYVRFEVIAGLVNALTLFVLVVGIAFEAVRRFRDPAPVLAGPMLVVAVLGLFVNVFVLWFLSRGDTDHVNVEGARLHVLGDLLGSVGAIVAALAIQWTGWMPIDPILSVLVSGVVLRSAWSLFGKSLHILLEGAPDGVSPDVIEAHLVDEVAGVAAVRHIHVWSLTSGQVLATLHVRPQNDVDARRVVRDVEAALLHRFGIAHATVAIEWNEDARLGCTLGGSAHHD